jgi:hypothetical protein
MYFEPLELELGPLLNLEQTTSSFMIQLCYKFEVIIFYDPSEKA